MDAFATYDKAASELDNVASFWAEVNELLTAPDDVGQDQRRSSSGGGGNEGAGRARASSYLVRSRLTSFFALCEACYDSHLEQTSVLDEVLTKLLDSPLLHSLPPMDVANSLISLVSQAKSLPTLHLLFDAILLLGHRNSDIYKSTLAVTQLIPRLVHHFWAARYAEEYLNRESTTTTTTTDRGGNGAEGGMHLDWNIRHVRNVSMGDVKKQREEARDRRLQCRLRDESVVLLYEVCRAQRMELKDMRECRTTTNGISIGDNLIQPLQSFAGVIDATFVNHLFDLVEASRHWHDDSYNYQLIKLIVALNEQFMVAGIADVTQKGNISKSNAGHSNIVMTVLRTRLNASNTFAENLIWMLNRASSLSAEDVCMQLLVLKLLYLLFTTRETAHYFYLNDLKVLVDVFVRELSDLPEESESVSVRLHLYFDNISDMLSPSKHAQLRHTYLRVLHPLLTNTQLLTYPYKRTEIRMLLQRLISHGHLRDISATTKRLVDRCLKAEWCTGLEMQGQAPDGIPGMGEERYGTLTVQSISGGRKTQVQAQITRDAEGIAIPMTDLREPFQGAPSSTASTMAVAAAPSSQTEERSDAIPSVNLPDSLAEDMHDADHTPVKFRDKRINSVGGLSPRARAHLALQADLEETRPGMEVTSARRDVNPSSSLSVRRDLGQRASSARSAPLSPRALDALRRKDLADCDTDEEEASRWTDGSGSSSWQFGMAGDQVPLSGQRMILASPLSLAHLESSLGLTTSPIEAAEAHSLTFDGSGLRAEQVPDDDSSLGPQARRERDMTSASSSTAGSNGHARRRKPPAPPQTEGGDAAKRRGYLSSASETNLPSTSIAAIPSRKDHLSRLGGATTGEMMSLPGSPLAESNEPSREPSPSVDNMAAALKRRRPPPPPINRSTKGVRGAAMPQQMHEPAAMARNGTATSSESATASEDRPGPHASYTSSEAGRNGSSDSRHLDQAMQYLYVSDGGYGW